jgi:hypothetical protein
LSVSEMGAPHFLGNPVVSVSNIKYIVSKKQIKKVASPVRLIWLASPMALS